MSDIRIGYIVRDADLARRYALAAQKCRDAQSAFDALTDRSDLTRIADCTEALMRAERELGFVLREAQKRKDAWIAAARASFQATAKQSCAVCGKFQSVAHAHHVVPLSAQYERGFDQPDHRHVWLCPNHHAIVHVLIYPYSNDQARGRAAASVVCDVSDSEFEVIMRLLGYAGEGK